MSDKTNKYGYVGAEPTQSFGNNTGVFDPNDINNLIADNKWTSFGQLELIETKEISGVSSAIFTDIQENTYNVHFLTINDFQPATDNTDLRIRFFSGATEYSGTTYQYAYQYGEVGGLGFGEVKSTGADHIRATFNTGNATNEKAHSYVYFYNLGDSSKYSFTTHQGMTGVGAVYMHFGSGVQTNAVAMTQIKLFNASGNFSATASLYGIRYS